MKEINAYIIEKLRINKDTELDKSIINLYNEGDICLFLTKFTNTGGGIFIGIDTVRIFELTDNMVRFTHLTDIYTSKNAEDFIKFRIEPHDNYIFNTRLKGQIDALIPAEDGINIIEKLNSSDKSLDIREIIFDDFKAESAGPNRLMPISVVERSSDDYSISAKRKLITNKSLKEIEDILKRI